MPKLRDIATVMGSLLIWGLLIWGFIAWLGWYALLIPATLFVAYVFLMLEFGRNWPG